MKRFILLLLVLASFRFSYAEELSAEMKLLAKEQVESIFLDGDAPVRYYSNILIRLDGNPTKEDSLIFKGLVDTLNVLIAKWDVYLIPKRTTTNLIVEINTPNSNNGCKIVDLEENSREIIARRVFLGSQQILDFTARKKLVYYYVFRSLVKINDLQSSKTNEISGSIFSETDPMNITFNPIDFEIIKEVYSHKYERKPGAKSKIRITANNGFTNTMLFSLVSLLLSFSFLIFMSLRGKFKEHNYQFLPFWRQGLLVVFAGSISTIVSTIFLNSSQSIVNIIQSLFVSTALQFTTGIVIVILVFLIERKILKKNKNFSLEIIIPFFSVALVATVLLVFFLLLIPAEKPVMVYYAAVSSVAFYCFIIGFGRSIYIFTRKKSENIIREKDLELAKMGELQKQAELQSLRAKINPHFLYNALNSIASLATTDARKTEQMALALSDFFKYAINREQKQLNTLSEELNAIRTYLEIEKVRFGDRLSFEIDCPTELLDIQIPQLLIQPLVENAIKHGLSQITENGLIRISVSKADDQLKIRVYDNGPAFPDGPLSGFGIQNTQERIALLYGAKASVNWENGINKYIELCLPLVP